VPRRPWVPPPGCLARSSPPSTPSLPPTRPCLPRPYPLPAAVVAAPPDEISPPDCRWIASAAPPPHLLLRRVAALAASFRLRHLSPYVSLHRCLLFSPIYTAAAVSVSPSHFLPNLHRRRRSPGVVAPHSLLGDAHFVSCCTLASSRTSRFVVSFGSCPCPRWPVTRPRYPWSTVATLSLTACLCYGDWRNQGLPYPLLLLDCYTNSPMNSKIQMDSFVSV
jgi:hypothetical protein